MIRENMRKWVDALRSDEFEQTTGYLCKADRYCCLGVLCELAIRDGVEIGKVPQLDFYAYDSSASFPPRSAFEWLGVEGVAELMLPGKEFDLTPIEANDDWGLSFHDIADGLEARYLSPQAVS